MDGTVTVSALRCALFFIKNKNPDRNQGVLVYDIIQSDFYAAREGRLSK
jgi:hypothetical protein